MVQVIYEAKRVEPFSSNNRFEKRHNHGFAFKRGTSLTRDDTGNGACETIYVQEVEVLRAGGGPWRWLLWPAIALSLTGLIVWLRTPFRVS